MTETEQLVINYDDRQEDELKDLLIRIDGIIDHEFRTDGRYPVVELTVLTEKWLDVKQRIADCEDVQTFDPDPVKSIGRCIQ